MFFSDVLPGARAALVGTVLTVGVADRVGVSPQVAVLAAAGAAVVGGVFGVGRAVVGPSASMAALPASRIAAMTASLLIWFAPRLRLQKLLSCIPPAVTSGIVAGAGVVIVVGFIKVALGQPAATPAATPPVLAIAAFAVVMAVEAKGTLGDRFEPRHLSAVGLGSIVTALAIGVPSTAAAARSQALGDGGRRAFTVKIAVTLVIVPFVPALLEAAPPVVLSALLLPAALRLLTHAAGVQRPHDILVWAMTATTVAVGGFVIAIAVGLAADAAIARLGPPWVSFRKAGRTANPGAQSALDTTSLDMTGAAQCVAFEADPAARPSAPSASLSSRRAWPQRRALELAASEPWPTAT